MSKINKELAQLLVDYGKKMYREGLVTGTGGNISLRVPGENAFLISPSGMPYEEITVDDIVMMD
ncbi:MAG: class II aldolase/adducin family protein, partial [Tepidanaerobacteraceae bacterium]